MKGILKCIGIVSGLLFILSACSESKWEPNETILLGETTPIGIATLQDEIWLSDGNNNRLVQIDNSGKVIGQPIDIERPMHISSDDKTLYIPSYGMDKIIISDGKSLSDSLSIPMELDAPAAVDISGQMKAVADFYNHRVLFFNGSEWIEIGKKGKSNGEMHYPTDLQFFGDKLYVADAYNNRGQVFDLMGNHILTFGEDLGFNAATGIFVNGEHIILTDFENDRVGFFDHDGNHLYWIQEGLSNPADVGEVNNKLWILNFGGKYITVLEK